MMKRGCRVGCVVLPNGEAFVQDTLTRFDPHLRSAPAGTEVDVWSSAVGALAEETHADGVVLPIAVEDYSRFGSTWGNRVLFSPTLALSDDEVEERWRSVVALVS